MVGSFAFFAVVLLIMALTHNVAALLFALGLFVVPVVFWMLNLMWENNPPEPQPSTRRVR
jgi:hypothetical protein